MRRNFDWDRARKSRLIEQRGAENAGDDLPEPKSLSEMRADGRGPKIPKKKHVPLIPKTVGAGFRPERKLIPGGAAGKVEKRKASDRGPGGGKPQAGR